MPFIPVPNGVQCNVRMRLHEQQIENVLWFKAAVPIDTTVLQSIAVAVGNKYSATILPLLSTNLTMVEVFCVDMESDSGGVYSNAPATPPGGGVTGEALPNNCALCLTLVTGLRGRSYRGRVYVPALPESETSGNDVSSVLVNSLVTAYTGMITVVPSTLAVWSVCSRRHNKVERPSGVLTPIVTVKATDNVVDSQRRRLPGRGK